STSSFSLLRPPPRPALFPYTTLFRSGHRSDAGFNRLQFLNPTFDALLRGFQQILADVDLARTRLELLAPGLQPLKDREARARERSEEHTSDLQSRGHLVCRLLLERKK